MKLHFYFIVWDITRKIQVLLDLLTYNLWAEERACNESVTRQTHPNRGNKVSAVFETQDMLDAPCHGKQTGPVVSNMPSLVMTYSHNTPRSCMLLAPRSRGFCLLLLLTPGGRPALCCSYSAPGKLPRQHHQVVSRNSSGET